MGFVCFPSTEQGWAGPKSPGLQGPRAASPRCLETSPQRGRGDSGSTALGPAGVSRLQVRGTPPGTPAPGAAGRAGAAEDPVSLQPGTGCPRRVQAPSAGAGGRMASAGGGAGAPGGRVGTGRTPGPAAPRRARRPRGRPRHRRRRLAAPASRQRSRRGAGGDGARGRGAAVSRYRPQRPLTRAPPRSPPPARGRAPRAPPIGPRAPPRPRVGVCTRPMGGARGPGGRRGGGRAARANRRGVVETENTTLC